VRLRSTAETADGCGRQSGEGEREVRESELSTGGREGLGQPFIEGRREVRGCQGEEEVAAPLMAGVTPLMGE
jgi:hypothetical protein